MGSSAPNKGQAVWNSAGEDNSNIVRFETSKTMAFEMRHTSIFGKLSRKVQSQMVGQGPHEKTIDITGEGIVWRKSITSGDEVRFTMEENITGAPTFGDASVRQGSYQSFLHERVLLNQTDSPANKIPGKMSRQRVKETISNPESSMRNQQTLWLAEQYVYDCLDGHFLGSSMNLYSDRSDGGRSIDLGLGAGVQVSPSNFIVAGSGVVSGLSGSSTFETNLAAALSAVTASNTNHQISRGFIQDVRDAILDFKIQSAFNNEEMYICACDPQLMYRLTKEGGELASAYKDARERSKNNPYFLPESIVLDNIMFYPEYRMKHYRPDRTAAAGGTVQWGPLDAPLDRRITDIDTISDIALCTIFGRGALLEATGDAVWVTVEHEKHEKGTEISSHIMQSIMRASWKPEDSRKGTADDFLLNQSSVTLAFGEPGPTFGV